MRRILIGTSFFFLFYCKYCIRGARLVIEIDAAFFARSGHGRETCGSAWDAPGADACFTEYGASHNMCGPEQQVLATPPSELRLVSVSITTPPVRARGGRHQKG